MKGVRPTFVIHDEATPELDDLRAALVPVAWVQTMTKAFILIDTELYAHRITREQWRILNDAIEQTRPSKTRNGFVL